MVNGRGFLIAIIISCVSTVSFSNTAILNYTGEYLSQLRVPSVGVIYLNYSHVEDLQIHGAQIEKLEGFQLRAKKMSVHNSVVSQVELSKSELIGSEWRQTKLNKALFLGADLRNAIFDQVNLTSVNLSRADLRGAKFLNTEFVGGTFEGSLYDNQTVLPFDPQAEPERGMIYVP